MAKFMTVPPVLSAPALPRDIALDRHHTITYITSKNYLTKGGAGSHVRSAGASCSGAYCSALLSGSWVFMRWWRVGPCQPFPRPHCLGSRPHLNRNSRWRTGDDDLHVKGMEHDCRTHTGVLAYRSEAGAQACPGGVLAGRDPGIGTVGRRPRPAHPALAIAAQCRPGPGYGR